jgi:hypothetical protein
MDDNIKQYKGAVKSIRFVGQIWLDTWPEGVDPFEKIASYLEKEIRFIGYAKETCPLTERAYLQCWIQFYHSVRMGRVRTLFPECPITSALEPFNQDKLYLSKQSTMIKHGTYIEGRNVTKRSFNGVVDMTHKKTKTTCELSDAGDKSIIDDFSKRFEDPQKIYEELRKGFDEVRKQFGEVHKRFDKSDKQDEEHQKENDDSRTSKNFIEPYIKKKIDRYRITFEEKWGSEIHSATTVLKHIYRYVSPLGVELALRANATPTDIRLAVDTAIQDYTTANLNAMDYLDKITFAMAVDLFTHMRTQFNTKIRTNGNLFTIA